MVFIFVKGCRKTGNMASQDLRRLSRRDLLELLLRARKENEALQREVERLRRESEERQLALDHLGSVAEASLELNGVFDAAQKAADQYRESAERTYREQWERAQALRAQNDALEKEIAQKRLAAGRIGQNPPQNGIGIPPFLDGQGSGGNRK